MSSPVISSAAMLIFSSSSTCRRNRAVVTRSACSNSTSAGRDNGELYARFFWFRSVMLYVWFFFSRLIIKVLFKSYQNPKIQAVLSGKISLKFPKSQILFYNDCTRARKIGRNQRICSSPSLLRYPGIFEGAQQNGNLFHTEQIAEAMAGVWKNDRFFIKKLVWIEK